MTHAATDRPSAVDGLEINEVDDGLVLYQPAPEQVHYLNSTAAVVFELCSGRLTVEEITSLVGSAFALSEPPVVEVASCIDDLRAKGVVR
jgi:hypothetical protein